MKIIDRIYFWYCKRKAKYQKKKMNRKTRNQIISSISRHVGTNTVIYDSICDINYSYEEVKDICNNLKVPIRVEKTQWSKRIFLDYIK